MADTTEGANGTNPTLRAEVTDRLREEVLSGAFEPGAPLREIPLAKRYAASRQTIREAFRALAGSGLVELHERRGARIPKISPKRARETYTLRAMLEPQAIRAALVEGHIRGPEMERIEAAFAHMADCARRNDVAALIEADMSLHWELCSPCGHELLLDVLKRLQTSTRQSMLHMKVYGTDAEGEVEMHTPILQAVRARDAEGAAVALRDHITFNGERLLMKLLELHLPADD